MLFILGLSAIIHGKGRKSIGASTMDNPMYKWMGHGKGCGDRGGHGGTVPTENTGCPSCPSCGLGHGHCRQHRPAAREARGHPGCTARRRWQPGQLITGQDMKHANPAQVSGQCQGAAGQLRGRARPGSPAEERPGDCGDTAGTGAALGQGEPRQRGTLCRDNRE